MMWQRCEEGAVDSRQGECEKYNLRSFAGKRYEWDAYNSNQGQSQALQENNACS